jgi:hypothetical protein
MVMVLADEAKDKVLPVPTTPRHLLMAKFAIEWHIYLSIFKFST